MPTVGNGKSASSRSRPVEEVPHLQSRAPAPHSKWNREFVKQYWNANYNKENEPSVSPFTDPHYREPFDDLVNRNTQHNKVTRDMLDIQLNNPELMQKLYSPRAPHRPNITSLHQHYNMGKASYAPPIPLDEDWSQVPRLESYENLDGTFHPRELMSLGEAEGKGTRRPKSAGAVGGAYMKEFGTLPANKVRDARVPAVRKDRVENNRDLGSGGFGMDGTAETGKSISRKYGSRQEQVPLVTESARNHHLQGARPQSADPVFSSRSVATYSEYPAEAEPEKPAFADWDIRELSTLSPKKQQIYN